MMSFHQQQQMMHGDGLVAQRSIMTPMGQGLTVTPFMPLIKKPDFPPDMQMVFVIPQIANIGKQTDKTKCRPLDPVIGTGRYSEWILDRFEDGWEAEARLNSLPQVQPNVPKPKNDKMAKGREQVIQNLQKWNPYEKEEMTTDPFKTLFVGRLSYQTNEKRLRKEFETYGSIKSVHIMKNVITGESRGYAFIEFEHKSDFLEAYKYGEGKRIDGRKIIVDYERGRTQLKWRPRRLGGGLGDTRRTKSVEVKRDVKDDEKRSKSKSSRSVSNHRRRGGNRDDFRLRLRRSPPQRRGGGGGFRGGDNDRGPRNFGGGRDFRDNHFQRGGEYHHNNQHQQHNAHPHPHQHPHVHMQQPVQTQPLQLKRMEIEKRDDKEARDRSRSRSEKKHRKRDKGGLDFKDNKDGKDKKKDKKKHKKHRDDDPYDMIDNQELGQVDGSQKKKKKRKDDKDKKKKKRKE